MNPGNPPYNPGYPPPVGYPQPGYPPPAYPPPAYPQPVYPQVGQPTAPTQTVTVSTAAAQPNVVCMTAALGQRSQGMSCPSCHARIQTKVESKTSNQAHIWALVLCIFACWPCCLIPYCMDSCSDADHYCPNCNAYIGAYKC